MSVEGEFDDIDSINATHASQFRLSLEHFSFTTPESSPYRRFARLGVKVEGVLSAPVPSPKKRVRQTDVKSPRKAKRKKGYAAPEIYAHLDYLTDCLAENLEGLTDRLIPPSEDHTLPSQYSLGIINLVDRPSSGADELTDKEMVNSVPALLQKVIKYKPRILCFIGKGMWLNVEKGFKSMITEKAADSTFGLGLSFSPSPQKEVCIKAQRSSPSLGSRKRVVRDSDNGFGLRPYKVVHPDSSESPIRETLFFCSPSSSGLVTTILQLIEKTNLLKKLRQNVQDHKNGSIDTSTMQEVPTK